MYQGIPRRDSWYPAGRCRTAGEIVSYPKRVLQECTRGRQVLVLPRHHRRPASISVVRVLALWLLVSPAAQTADGTNVAGRVTDPQGSSVAEARLTLTTSSGSSAGKTVADEHGDFALRSIEPGTYTVTAQADGFETIARSIAVAPGQPSTVQIQFLRLAKEVQQVNVVASLPKVLNPDPGQTILFHDELLEANPGRPGAPVSIPGLPIETASGGVKAPQYFAPGVAGDHGEPIAQFYQLGDYLYPNNLPANAHGNGYSDPNFLIPIGIGAVEADGGGFNVREGNHAVNLAAAYGPQPRLEPFFQLTEDFKDVDVVTGWSPTNPDTLGWIALEASYGNGFLTRPEHRQQYKLNGYRVYNLGRHQLTLFGIGYYGFSYVPGLIPIDVSVPGDTIDSRQLDRTHTSIAVATDTWDLSNNQKLIFAGFFRTYNLTLRSNFGDGLIQQSEFRTVAGGNTSYIYRFRPQVTLLAGIDIRRDAPRGLDLKRADEEGVFHLVTSNDLTLDFAEPFLSLDGELTRYLHYDLGVRQAEVNMDNFDRINPANSFNRTQGITLPKGTLTLLPLEQNTFPRSPSALARLITLMTPVLERDTAAQPPSSFPREPTNW